MRKLISKKFNDFQGVRTYKLMKKHGISTRQSVASGAFAQFVKATGATLSFVLSNSNTAQNIVTLGVVKFTRIDFDKRVKFLAPFMEELGWKPEETEDLVRRFDKAVIEAVVNTEWKA